jgi:hypothetical protein
VVTDSGELRQWVDTHLGIAKSSMAPS